MHETWKMSGEGYLVQEPGFDTKAIHAGQDPERWSSWCMVPPIILSTTFKQEAPPQHKGFVYARDGNPSREVLEQCLASLDNGKYGLCFSSGLAATTNVISLLNAGDHIVAMDDMYGGTYELLSKVFDRMNIKTTFVDARDPEKVGEAIQENTKLVWIETPTNPLLKVVDIKRVAEIVHAHKGVILAVDNTFLSSYFQRPLMLGADLVVYSLTKYMNGHTDVVMGAVVTNSQELHERLKFLQMTIGAVPSPFDCYLVYRGLKTLPLRMEQHMKNCLAVGRFLEQHPCVEKVLNPGLPSHPQHQLVKRQSSGYSGMMSFYLKGGLEESRKFLSALKVFTLAESLGGYESLAELPSLMTHVSVPAEERARIGLTDNLIRLAVGLESTQDLIDDLDQALRLAVK
ncbi:cystathionine gamma-lyase-like isoform X1 [Anabrus simplex]|uniref:cystathionine gamma-lyase-like isoform X1 n=3 Tax=Anabrus simplex TaxID=316456 RepID=UPI0035A31939